MSKFWRCWRKEHEWAYDAQRGWLITNRIAYPDGARIRCRRCGAINKNVVEVQP